MVQLLVSEVDLVNQPLAMTARFTQKRSGDILSMEHYFKTTNWLVSREVPLQVGSNCRIRSLSGPDMEALREEVRKRNVFSRHAGPGDFYYRRATALLDTTVVEVCGGGESAAHDLASRANLAEEIVAASLVLHGRRRDFLRRVLGSPTAYVDLHLVKRGHALTVKSTRATVRHPTGLILDAAAITRYQKLGFAALFELAVGGTELGSRMRVALGWLAQSRTDPSSKSALVKTSTALESLLVIGREPPTRTLAERSAYLLSDDPAMRPRIAKAALRFYTLRGQVVHGRSTVTSPEIERVLEFGDRLAVLLGLVVAAQRPTWRTASDVQKFCDRARWGLTSPCIRPWAKSYLGNTLARLARDA